SLSSRGATRALSQGDAITRHRPGQAAALPNDVTTVRHLAISRHRPPPIIRRTRFANGWPVACGEFGSAFQLPQTFGMTFRVLRARVDDMVVLTLSGDIAGRHAADLQALIDAELDQRLVLDLSEAAVVDRAGVLLLAWTEASGAALTNCPAYVRE